MFNCLVCTNLTSLWLTCGTATTTAMYHQTKSFNTPPISLADVGRVLLDRIAVSTLTWAYCSGEARVDGLQ